MAALLDARLLIFNMIARHAHFNEAPDQVAHMGVAAMTRVGVGNDKWPVVDLRGLRAFFFTHAQTQEILIAVRSE